MEIWGSISIHIFRIAGMWLERPQHSFKQAIAQKIN